MVITLIIFNSHGAYCPNMQCEHNFRIALQFNTYTDLIKVQNRTIFVMPYS